MLDFGFYNMDCMEGMKQFPDKYFDLAVVDPPYGINVTGTPGGVTNSGFLSGGYSTNRRCKTVWQQSGGVSLSRPKATRHSMTATYRMPHISPNWSEWQNTELYSVGIISLTILAQLNA